MMIAAMTAITIHKGALIETASIRLLLRLPLNRTYPTLGPGNGSRSRRGQISG